jgi:ankyrin repeat protein
MKPVANGQYKINNVKKTTSAGKWSVALAVIPIGGILLFLLPVFLRPHGGDAGLGAIVAIGFILFHGTHIAVGTGLLGVVLGFLAICKTHWRQGAPGLILNISVLILAGAYLTTLYRSVSIDPDRLPIAAYRGEIKTVKKLLDRGFDVNYGFQGDTALSNAAERNHEQIVELLLSYGADVNIGDPLGGAAKNANEKLVRLLLERGADPNSLGNAVRGHNVEIVKLLLDHGADINRKVDENRRTPLHIAVKSGVEEIVVLLIKNGADVNAKKSQGMTPLHVLVQMWPHPDWPENFRERVIILLLDAGADIEAEATRERKTPLYLAAETEKSLDAVKLLLERGADLANIGDLHVRFVAAPFAFDKEELSVWVKENASDINIKSSQGESLLHSAVKAGSIDLVDILLKMRVDVNVKSKTGETALHRAMTDPIPQIVDSLVSYGANINAQNNKGRTPLHILSESVHRGGEKPLDVSKRKTFEILLAKGAKVDIADKDGRTPLGQQMSWLPATKEGREYKNELILLMQNHQ